MMAAMNPFDQPPSEPPVSLDPPSAAPSGPGPRRGRIAIATLAAMGLVGGGIVVAGQLASADDAVPQAAEPPAEEPTTDETTDETTGEQAPADDDSGFPSIDGEIILDDGDGDPLVLDLGAIGECLGPIFGGGPLFGDEPLFEGGPMWDGEGMPPLPFDELPFPPEFEQRMEEFLDDLSIDDLEGLDDGVRIFGSGGSTITVVGPDGVEIIDLGDGDATVTIEQSDGELTIETEGDASVGELPDLGALLPELGELELGELDPGTMEDWSEMLPFDPDAIESCLDDLD